MTIRRIPGRRLEVHETRAGPLIATAPAQFVRLGGLHRGIDDDAYSLDTLLGWAERDGLR